MYVYLENKFILKEIIIICYEHDLQRKKSMSKYYYLDILPETLFHLLFNVSAVTPIS